ncbi:uncharacterized protein RCC_02021 [Ramularia collo-cygni]|uniref:Uncharacterized protein n=1 Tax=Ramularia collo-cygni TaxID=112498 RepID=A0A2D3V3U8_9PEZI|nr:uncharacterized protein RCC_02021 [Ramularia collo-cygni]CZT16179.1 uncharacterized protein RCC_02021 [Ramularia collo-cygni]
MTDRTASQDHPDSSQQVFRFLDLAAEIRNEIYSFVVVGENRVYDLAVFIPPAIARASTQLRSESLPIIFADAEFYVNVVSNVHVSLNCLHCTCYG